MIVVNGQRVERRFRLPDGREAVSFAVYTSRAAAMAAFDGADVELAPLATPRDGCSFAWVMAAGPAGKDEEAPR